MTGCAHVASKGVVRQGREAARAGLQGVWEGEAAPRVGEGARTGMRQRQVCTTVVHT